MKIKCDYCSNTYEDTQPRCPSCGAPNPSQNPTDKKPRTIEELAEWYQARKLPPYETTRFFIGINYQYPKAFGIYKDENGDFIVYKNKDTGERAIRYKGKDEAYAVNELWQKLKDEIVNQKNHNKNGKAKGFNTKKFLIFFAISWFLIALLTTSLTYIATRHNGYYNYNNTVYYKDSSSWYSYDDYYDTWYETSEPFLYDETNTDPYYMGNTYSNAQTWDDGTTFSDVKQSTVYEDNHTSSSDSNYDWGGNDSWNSGGTDWGSDW